MNQTAILSGLLPGILFAALIIGLYTIRSRRDRDSLKNKLTFSRMGGIVATILLVGMCIISRPHWQLLTTGISAQGTIVSFESCGKNDLQVIPIVQFTDTTGIFHTHLAGGSTMCLDQNAYRGGEQIPILYAADDPTNVIGENSMNFDTTFLSGVITGLFLITAWCFAAAVRLKRLMRRSQQFTDE